MLTTASKPPDPAGGFDAQYLGTRIILDCAPNPYSWRPMRRTEPANYWPGFYSKLIITKGSPEPGHTSGNTVRTAVYREWSVLHNRAVCIARHSHLYIWSDSGCTAVRADPSGCTFVRKGSSYMYICTVRVYVCTDGVVVVSTKKYALIAPGFYFFSHPG
jgi:hypothetical protein